ncbi:hypothetical protein [Streptomyces sp. NPDC050704]|uniref:hypothetical protein n=1 Tax=Streptomyces sp. NPDC050704 TaxID=3157219 RepID=UPI003445FEDC
MIRMLAALVATADVVGFLLCIGVAIDVIRQHPYEWIQTGSTQGFRIFLIFAPPLAILLGPIYLVPGIFYLRKVRPRLVHNAHIAAGQGWPTVPRKPILGLNWAWCELRTPQRVKTVLSAGGAFSLDIFMSQIPQPQDSPPQWLIYAMLAFLWPLFFFTAYLILGAMQIFLNLKMNVPFPKFNDSSSSIRMQVLVQKEYSRRVNEFHKNHPPQTRWDQQP